MRHRFNTLDRKERFGILPTATVNFHFRVPIIVFVATSQLTTDFSSEDMRPVTILMCVLSTNHNRNAEQSDQF
jgi:hypothetical protein